MKKKNLNSLTLNKKSITNFNLATITGAHSTRAESRNFRCPTLYAAGCMHETVGACTTLGPLCLP